MPKTRLSKTEYMQALALFTVASQHYAKCREMELALCELLGFNDGYADCVSDAIYNGQSLDVALKQQGIKKDAKKLAASA